MDVAGWCSSVSLITNTLAKLPEETGNSGTAHAGNEGAVCDLCQNFSLVRAEFATA